MAKTLQQASAALAANTANFASMGLSSAAEVSAIAQFLAVAASQPGLAMPALRLVNDKNLTEHR